LPDLRIVAKANGKISKNERLIAVGFNQRNKRMRKRVALATSEVGNRKKGMAEHHLKIFLESNV
jgi:hypothetical protein